MSCNPEIEIPPTEGVKYAGSKLKLIKHILNLAAQTNSQSVFDAFSGTTRVSQAFAKSGYRVTSNDISTWSKTFATCYLQNQSDPPELEELISHLNNLPPKDGWFSEHYGGPVNDGSAVHPADGLKRPWQLHNTMKLDAIRDEIDQLNLGEHQKSVAITSLILALDRTDSTLGHFTSYLREWSPRSYRAIQLKVPMLFRTDNEHQVHLADVFDLLPRVSADIAYLDPPYGSNNEKMPPSRVRYASYYHLWTTICLNDQPELFGKAARRQDSSDTVAASIFEEFRKDDNDRYLAIGAIDRLVREVQAEWVILSYSSGGRATAEELLDVLSDAGEIIDVVSIDYKANVMAGMKWTNEWLREAETPNREFLFLLRK